MPGNTMMNKDNSRSQSTGQSGLRRLFPFLAWFPMSRASLRADLLAGLTVSLVLIPQSMAYAQLAGLPVVYGLYAGFIPVIVASLWGSLAQLHTGPTAMLSLLSAAALVPFASPGSEHFIELSLMLALLVGLLRLALGLFRLGILVNFLSHPVTIGFTNAAALIIGLSQLNKLINVPMPRTEVFMADLWVVVQQLNYTHWPTLAFALGAWIMIYAVQKFIPRLPAILLAIVVTTLISYLTGFERIAHIDIKQIADPALQQQIEKQDELQKRIKEIEASMRSRQAELDTLEAQPGADKLEIMDVQAASARDAATLKMLLTHKSDNLIDLRHLELHGKTDSAGQQRYFIVGKVTEGEPVGSSNWRIIGVDGAKIKLSGGGEVVGTIPAGVPAFEVPPIEWKLVLPLLPAALVMALLGFMEATSISKAISAKTGQRVDTNRELVGQGLANIVGSFFSSYVVSGSFSRSAMAGRLGAKTGLFAVISALSVLLVMLFLTPLLYHLPQAVLAVVIMLAVFGLIQVRPLIYAWKVNRLDALTGLITFVVTLAMAPALGSGILLGVVMTIALYLFRNMRPRAEILGRQPDGSLGGIDSYAIAPISQQFVVIRFDGSLNFVNVAYFEEKILEALNRFPASKALLIIGNGINDIDVSGEEKLRALIRQLKGREVTVCLSSLKKPVRQVLEGDSFKDILPPEHVFKTKEVAIQTMLERYGK